MVSQAKIDANRLNAAKSTGPRTSEGKDKVRLAARAGIVGRGLPAAAGRVDTDPRLAGASRARGDRRLGNPHGLGNLVRALGLLGVRVADPDDAAFAATTAVPLAATLLRAWQAVKDQALREFLQHDLDEDDDPPPPEGPELVAPEVIAS